MNDPEQIASATQSKLAKLNAKVNKSVNHSKLGKQSGKSTTKPLLAKSLCPN